MNMGTSQKTRGSWIIQLFLGYVDSKRFLNAQKKPVYKDQRALENQTGRYLQMLSRDEI